jgi:hypothetical protein
MKLILFLTILTLGVGCFDQSDSSQKKESKLKSISDVKSDSSIIWEQDNYILSGKIDFEDDSVIAFYEIKLSLNGNVIFNEESCYGFWWDKFKTPKVRIHKMDNRFVIQYEVDDRPLKPKMRLVYLTAEELITTYLLPDNFEKLNQIDYKLNQTIGTLNYSEAYCMDCDTVFYNPKLVYNISIIETMFDSSETVKINTKEYGMFLGFDYSTDILVSRN